MDKVKVGVIGCGNISDIYIKNLTTVFDVTEVAACADMMPERSCTKAQKFGIPKYCTVEELLADPSIQIILNLTTPGSHAEVAMKALEAGKHVYSEKPLAISREDGKGIIDMAKNKGLLVGNAPDTFLGGGIQTCIKLIDDGWIGRPVAATAFMLCHGHESWHPDPEFYYQVGGGPMFDMGPYYLTALVAMLGPVRRLTGSARITFDERVITSQPKYGRKINVEVPTHIAGILDFDCGAIATIVTSFDVWASQTPRMEIYGSEGTLIVPDPNTFGGPILLKRKDTNEWKEIPLVYGFSDNSRGIGVADMAYAILEGRPHRANGEMAFHVLDIMQGIHDASKDGTHYYPTGKCQRPEPLARGL
jgi:predicted dehydrogenase